jgi:two-component system, chemotaxis family, sensor histidine kinase and response regulator WspE
MSKVFLAEDDEYISRVYERAFRLSGHEIDIHADGEDALSAIESATALPDVIIIDLSLPKMTGTELLSKVSADKRLDKVPVIVLTNSFNEKIEKSLLDAGADLYLLKIDHEPKDVVAKAEDLINKFKNRV